MTEKEILALEDRRFAAMIERDFGKLNALVHEGLLYTHSSGVTDTKASWLQSMQSGRVKYKQANCSERKVRIYGDVALITAYASAGLAHQAAAHYVDYYLPKPFALEAFEQMVRAALH